MNGVPFLGGPYDGASFSFSDRLPERVELSVRCCHADTPDPEYREALIALLEIEPDAPEDAIFVRHADSLTARYDQDSNEDGSPWFRRAGPSKALAPAASSFARSKIPLDSRTQSPRPNGARSRKLVANALPRATIGWAGAQPMKGIALIAWTGAVVAITVIEAANAGKRLTWDEVVAATIFLAAIALALFEGRSQRLRELLQRPIPRVLTLIVLAILGFLLLAPILRFD